MFPLTLFPKWSQSISFFLKESWAWGAPPWEPGQLATRLLFKGGFLILWTLPTPLLLWKVLPHFPNLYLSGW
jgi:hypothetical protein